MNSLSYDKNITPEEKKSIKASIKEEIGALFELKDIDIATEGLTQWFETAKSSQTHQLVKFAELKQKRLKVLIAHSKYPISKGELEGINNKIKKAKRIAYDINTKSRPLLNHIHH